MMPERPGHRRSLQATDHVDQFGLGVLAVVDLIAHGAIVKSESVAGLPSG
jgi:hypothetical protein